MVLTKKEEEERVIVLYWRPIWQQSNNSECQVEDRWLGWAYTSLSKLSWEDQLIQLEAFTQDIADSK